MYKDVWKKFGVKILIALCSVLLLGGVAVAAPMLRAAGEPDLDEVQGWVTNSGASIKLNGGDDCTVTYKPGTEKILPSTIKVEVAGVKTVRIRKEDYEVVENESSGNFNKVGNVTLVIRPANTLNDAEITYGGKLKIEYQILPAELEAGYNVAFETNLPSSVPLNAQNTDLVVTSKTKTIDKNDIKRVYLKSSIESQPDIEIAESDYQVAEKTGTTNQGELGDRKINITLTNYKQSDGSTIPNQVWERTCKVVKDIAALASQDASGDIVVTDPENAGLTKGTHYTQVGSGTVVVTGVRDYNYVGERTFNVGGDDGQPAVDFAPAIRSMFDTGVFEYNAPDGTGYKGGNGYKFKPDLIITNENNLELKANMYEVEWTVVGAGDVEIPGATAGTVMMTVTVNTSSSAKFNGMVASNKLYYRVRRDIKDAVFMTPDEQGDYTYEKGVTREKTPKIQFADASGSLRSDDITVKYDFAKRNGSNYKTKVEVDKPTDAGMVYTRVIGKLGKTPTGNAGGYYGELDSDGYEDYQQNGKYEIKPKSLLSSQQLRLQRNENIREFPVSSNEPKIGIDGAEPAYIWNGGNDYTSLNPADRGVEYNVYFFKDENCTQQIDSTEWETLSPDKTYYVRYDFIGNLDGQLKAPFKLHAYKKDEVDIAFVTGTGGCTDGTECNPITSGGGHIYNGRAHEPKIVVTANGTNDTTSGKELVEGVDYDKTYSADTTNVDSSEIKVIVTLRGSGDIKEKPFTISPLSINNDVSNGGTSGIGLALPGEYAGSPLQHEYSGRTSKPKLKSLTFSKPAWDGEGVMNNLTDYVSPETPPEGARQDFNVLDLYEWQLDGSWKIVKYSASSKPALKLHTNYRFQVEGVGNYTGKGYTDIFQFSARDINKAEFLNEPKVMPNGTKDTSITDILAFLTTGTTRVRLQDLGDELECDENGDYIIYIGSESNIATGNLSDFRSTLGLIEYTIVGKGCYEGSSRKETLYIGKDIAETELWEKNKLISVSNGVRKLAGSYGTTVDDLPFWKGDTTQQNINQTIYLWYHKGAASEQEKLVLNEKYLVTVAPPEDRDPGQPKGQYCTVTVQGINGYYGTTTFEYDIIKKDIAKCIVLVEKNDFRPGNEDWVYTGERIEPEVWVFPEGTEKAEQTPDNPNMLVLGKDYTVNYDKGNCIKANEDPGQDKALIEIIGLSVYSSTSKDVEFTIKKRSLNKTDDQTKIASYFKLKEKDEYGSIGDGERLKGDYKYRTTSKVTLPSGQISSANGVCPEFEIFFDPTGNWDKSVDSYTPLEFGTDFKLRYEKNTHVFDHSQDGAIMADSPVVIVEPMGTNFTGSFKVLFDIQAIKLSECRIEMTHSDIPFIASSVKDIVEPLVEVYQIVKDENGNEVKDFLPRVHKESDAPDAKEIVEYKVNVVNDIYVPNLSNGQGAGIPFVWIESVDGGNCIGKNGEDGTACSFKIVGDLARDIFTNKDAYDNTRVLWETTYVNYSKPFDIKTALTKIQDLKFMQKEKGTENWFTNTLDPVDYEIDLEADKIGEYTATVKGKGYYEKNIQVPVVIRANLDDLSYMDYEYPEPFTYVTGQAIDFVKLIKVKCGNDYLVYGKDYEFVGGVEALTAVPGTGYPVTVKAVEGAKYVTGQHSFTYDVKAGIDNSAQITMGQPDRRYEYAHGERVFNPSTEIKVSVGGTELKLNKDYKIEINEEDLINCGKKTFKIIGINSYDGETTGDFTIYEYDIAEHGDEVKIGAKDSVVYNGRQVFPDMDVSVLVSGTSRKLKASGGESEAAGEYKIERDTGDVINWTHDPNKKPTFAVQGIGNYTGRITGNAYSITRKPIDDPDVEFPGIEPQPYDNGRPVAKVPRGTFNGQDLEGEAYDASKADQYLNAPGGTSNQFTYRYITQDLKGVGTKEVRIEGLGNFVGSRTWSYEVVALQLSDTTLTVLGAPFVYDGRKQTPAFKLTYGQDTIAEFTGTRLISEMINNLKYEFYDNVDAGTATVKVWVEKAEGVSDNYTGEKEAPFTIQPASLAGHTKFAYRPADSESDVDLSTYQLKLPFAGGSLVRPEYAKGNDEGKLAELPEGQVGIYYNYAAKRNHGDFLVAGVDYETEIEYKYVQPDTEDEDVREEDYPDPNFGYAGKVRVTIKGTKNYADSASFWYFIGKDISSEASISMTPLTAVFNSRQQAPKVEILGIKDKTECKIVKYRNEIALENIIEDEGFVNAGLYYIRIEGRPENGTYSTKPHTLTYTITPRALSNSLVIDGFKREYSYTGYDICPVGISVTDYIDNVKYRLTEDTDYVLTYTNNLNAGTAYINIKGQNNFSGTATASFMITSSTISSGNYGGSNSFIDQGIGEISGSTAVSPSNVKLTMDTNEAMYYTGKALYPKVSIAGMTENVDYTVTLSNNVEVGTGVVTINGIGNNTGAITKNFRIIAQLSKCTIAPIPAQQHTGSPVTPALTVTCGNNILMEGTDYSVSYANNVNIGTATVTIRALNNANYIGTATAKFSIGNDVGGFIISGFAPTYTYTGKAITPGVVVETGSATLTQGTDYTVSYSNNTNVGTATITVTGVGKYSGTQTATFVIEAKNIQSCDTTEVEDRTYTGDAYTPSITVSDGSKVLQNGVDYTVTYTNNTNPGMASILIQGTGTNYSGTKVVSFKISAVAVKGLKASSVSYNYVKLKWTKQGYADGYQVCDSNSKVVKTVTGNSAKITGLSAGKTYKYKVRSYIKNADGTRSYGAFSSVLSTTTKLKTPTVKIVSNAKGQARISWSKVSGASGYEIYYKKSSGAKYKKLKTVNNADIRVCTVRGMKSGDRAYFRVRAFRKSGSKKVYSALNPLKVITVK